MIESSTIAIWRLRLLSIQRQSAYILPSAEIELSFQCPKMQSINTRQLDTKLDIYDHTITFYMREQWAS